MEEDKSQTTTQVTVLISKNYHLWIKEIKSIAKDVGVWMYVDRSGTEDTPTLEDVGRLPRLSDYQVRIAPQSGDGGALLVAPVLWPVRSIQELSDVQLKQHRTNQKEHQFESAHIKEMVAGIRKVQNAIKASASTYLSQTEKTSTPRQMIKTLKSRYKLSESKINEQLHARL
jgi:hypothetical protein